jgi:thioredoxin 2
MNTIELDERGLVLPCRECGQRNRMAFDRLGQQFRCGKCHQEMHLPAEPIEAPNEAAFNGLTQKANLPVLADFWAPWCGPCKMVAPELEQVAGQMAGRCIVVKVNTENVPSLAQRFQISGIPTFVLFKEGHEVSRQSGAMPAARIRQFIEQAEMAQR